MPELPEVETARRLARRLLAGRRLLDVAATPDPIVFDGASTARIAAALRGRRVLDVRRRGKYFWLVLDRRPWPVFHFGMTGRLLALPPDAPDPRFCKLRLDAFGGSRLAFSDPRRLGRVRLACDPEREPPVSRLGRDVLLDDLPPREFDALFARRSAPVKAVLLDQTVFAGVGNWIADEALYQARITPGRRVNRLTHAEIRRLLRTLKRIVRLAVRVGADDTRFPRNWLFHVRWDKRTGARTRDGRPLRFDAFGGRTTAWVPGRQT